MPIAEYVATLPSPNRLLNKLPAAVPRKNIGVTMPPLPPQPSVMEVVNVFQRKADLGKIFSAKPSSIGFKPKPK